MIFKTVTGSLYEIDQKNKKFRRLSGILDPTLRVGKDGQWKEYGSLLPNVPTLDSVLMIVWRVTDEGVWQTTVTSPIEQIDVKLE